MENQQKARTYLYNHTSQETAYLVQDYPWGFTLRTQQRHWVETKETHGQRFVTQTMNPKTNKWCAPKYSTYSKVIVMFLDENSHVKYTAIGNYDKEETVKSWIEKHGINLTQFQRNQLNRLIATEKVMKKVTFTIQPVNYVGKTIDEIEKEEQERKENNRKTENIILSHINAEYNRLTV